MPYILRTSRELNAEVGASNSSFGTNVDDKLREGKKLNPDDLPKTITLKRLRMGLNIEVVDALILGGVIIGSSRFKRLIETHAPNATEATPIEVELRSDLRAEGQYYYFFIVQRCQTIDWAKMHVKSVAKNEPKTFIPFGSIARRGWSFKQLGAEHPKIWCESDHLCGDNRYAVSKGLTFVRDDFFEVLANEFPGHFDLGRRAD